jgi:hypothetical protein
MKVFTPKGWSHLDILCLIKQEYKMKGRGVVIGDK